MVRSKPVARLIIYALAAALIGCSPVPTPPSAEPSHAGLVATPTAAPATPARSTVAPSPTPVLAPLPSQPMPMAVREAMTAPGAIVVANIEQGPSPWWVLTVHVVREEQPVVTGSIGIEGNGWDSPRQ